MISILTLRVASITLSGIKILIVSSKNSDVIHFAERMKNKIKKKLILFDCVLAILKTQLSPLINQRQCTYRDVV